MLRLGTRAASGVVAAFLLLVAGCDGDGIADNSAGARMSQAMSLWSPVGFASCSKADHDRYVVTGTDEKLYPTWHPAIDPVKGCSYGHEHGRDPHGSALYTSVGDVPFGVATEALNVWEPGHPRYEGHGDQKIEWQNGVMLQQDVDGQRVDIGVHCDFLVKFQQGAARPRPSNNPSELVYHVKCDDGTEIHSTMLVHSDQPATITTSEGAQLAYFDPRFGRLPRVRRSVPNPRSATQLLMDMCDMRDSSSDGAHSGGCDVFPNFKPRRLVYFNQTGIYNGGGPTAWYTDPFGGHASTAPFAGSVRQFVAPVTNDRGFALASQVFGGGTAHTSQ